MNRALIPIILLIISQEIWAKEGVSNESLNPYQSSGFGPLGGIFIDNINEFNIQFGMKYYYSNDFDILSSELLYSQFGISESTKSIEFGFGGSYEAGSTRYGINYIHTNKEPIVGINRTSSAFGVIVKFGFYNNYATHDPELLLGLGIGI